DSYREESCEQRGIPRETCSVSDLFEASRPPLSPRRRRENSGRKNPESVCIRRTGHGCRSVCDTQDSGLGTRGEAFLGKKKLPVARPRRDFPGSASNFLESDESGRL